MVSVAGHNRVDDLLYEVIPGMASASTPSPLRRYATPHGRQREARAGLAGGTTAF